MSGSRSKKSGPKRQPENPSGGKATKKRGANYQNLGSTISKIKSRNKRMSEY